MIQGIKRGLKNAIINTLQRDTDVYYGEFFGTSDPLPLFLKNLFRPQRYIRKLFYGQSFSLPQSLLNGKACPDNFDQFINTPQLQTAYEELRDTGISIISQFFTADQCDALLEKSNILLDLEAVSDDYVYSDMTVKMNNETIAMWLQPSLLAILGKYLGRLPFARYYPMINMANPNFTSPPTSKIKAMDDFNLNIGWHFDTVNLVQFAVLLNDVEAGDSCMQVVARTHQKHHQSITKHDYRISDDYIKKRGLKVVNCIGPKGTVYLFDANAYHRLYAVYGKPRTMFKCDFTPGNNILPSCEIIARALQDDPTFLEVLSEEQREIVSGLFPRKRSYGYNIGNQGLMYNQFHYFV